MATSGYVAGVYDPSKSTPYMNDYRSYEAQVNKNLGNQLARLAESRTAWRNEQENLANAYRTKLRSDNQKEVDKSNAQYDNAARQNYINYQRAQRDLPSQLNALGVRGGFTESSNLRLGTNYGTNVANNEASRNASLAALAQALERGLADYDKEYRQLLSSYDDTYNTNVQNARTTAQDRLTTAYSNALENERKAAAQDLTQFASAIEGQFDSRQGFLNLITALQKSNDPNKAAKIMLTRQAMNKWAEKQAELDARSSSSGGGRSYSSGGSSSSSGGGNNSSDSGNYSSMTDKYYKTLSKSYTPTNTKSSSSTKNSNLGALLNKYGTLWKVKK